MTSAGTRLTRWGNAIGVWLYRRTGGRLSGPGRGTTIGLLTAPGRKTGIPRTVSIGFHPYGAGYVVAGTGSGSRRDPQWFRNLSATTHAEIQIRSTRTEGASSGGESVRQSGPGGARSGSAARRAVGPARQMDVPLRSGEVAPDDRAGVGQPVGRVERVGDA